MKRERAVIKQVTNEREIRRERERERGRERESRGWEDERN